MNRSGPTRSGRRCALGVLVGIALLLAPAVSAKKAKFRDPHDLINIVLSPAYSQWMVGPTGELASDEEVERFLDLQSDEEAERFIEAFWEVRRNEPAGDGEVSMRAAMGLVDNPLRALFEERAIEADKRFTESGYLGRRTARGTVYVLFGEPNETDYEVNPDPDAHPIVVWTYERKRRGLDGRKPDRFYRFVREGDLTVPYSPGIVRPVRSRF